MSRRAFCSEFPFAGQYLKETWFKGPFNTLWLPNQLLIQPHPAPNNVILSRDGRTVNVGSRTASEQTEPLKLVAHAGIQECSTPCTIYFEVEVTGIDVQVGIGFDRTGERDEHKTSVCYESSGRVVLDEDERLTVEPYQSHDVVGCGFLWPSDTMIFTKNGRCVAQLREFRMWRLVAPEIQFTVERHSEMTLAANFGQRPFQYNIEAHCSTLTTPFREVASILPPELFEQILEHALALLDKDLLNPYSQSQAQLRRNHLSQVCRRWRTVCTRHSRACIWLESPKHFTRFASLAPAVSCHTLGMTSEHKSPWIQRFLLSPLPVSLAFSKWDCTVYTTVLWDVLPPLLSTRVPALMHSAGLAGIRELRLANWRFPSWLRFAQLVFAFSNLQTLVTDDVHLDDTEVLRSLPSWLRFHRRLQRWETPNQDTTRPANVNYKFLLLFVCGRPRLSPGGLALTREDADVMAELVRVLSELCYFKRIECAVPDSSKSRDAVLVGYKDDRELLRLEFQPHLDHHRLVAVQVAWDIQTPGSHPSKLRRLVDGLSSSQACKFRFDLSKLYTWSMLEDRALEAAQSLRRHVAADLGAWCAEGRVQFVYNGEVMEDSGARDVIAPGVRWMVEDPVKFTFSCQFGNWPPVGTRCTISWDTTNTVPGIKGIPWVKLYSSRGTPVSGTFVCDLEYDLYMSEGRLEFVVPDVNSDYYFLLIGDYIYRGPRFRIMPRGKI